RARAPAGGDTGDGPETPGSRGRCRVAPRRQQERTADNGHGTAAAKARGEAGKLELGEVALAREHARRVDYFDSSNGCAVAGKHRQHLGLVDSDHADRVEPRFAVKPLFRSSEVG